MPFTKDINNKILDFYLRGSDLTPPEELYLGLFTSDAGLSDNDLNVAQEMDYGNYSRIKARDAVTKTAKVAVDGKSSNDAAYVFPLATSSGGTPTHAALLDAPTGGNIIIFGAIAMPGGLRPIEAGLTYALGADQLKWSID